MRSILAAAAMAAVFGCGSATAGSLLGDSVLITEYYPTFGMQYGPAAGPLTIVASGTTFLDLGLSSLTAVVGPNQISIGLPSVDYGGTFNGFDIQDLNSNTTITGATFASSAGLTSGLSFDAHNVYLNLAGQGTNGSPVVIDVTATNVAGVPEPGAWVLMLVGLGAAGGLARSRRRAAPAI